MPLKGNLAVFTTTQLLNLINLSKKSGKLSLYEPVPTGGKLTLGDGQTKIEEFAPGKELASLHFKEGTLIYAQMDGKEAHLAIILQRAGKLNEEQAKAIREKLAALNDRGLALRLINANYVTKNDIVQSIQKHTVSIVFDLMGWKKEPFEFREGEGAPDDRILVPIDLKQVIIEGTRIHQQQKQLEDELPDLDLALKFPDDPTERFKKVQLGTDEWRVVGFINPKNSIRQIAKACNMTDTEIRRIVYALLQAGLVQLVKVQKPEQPQKRNTSMLTAKSETMKANAPSRAVVSRLIDKIKSI
jgi:DNA-binding MarR family transcriptional regulator